jgi:CheY-like chemotaxis protein
MTALQRIAVADDEKIIRDFYHRVLVRKGFNVVVIACNGRELVDGCRREEPDLIICDIHMPELDGLAAVDLISQFRPTPAIIVSALSELKQRKENESVLAYLIKPVGMYELEKAITLAECRLAQRERRLA